MNEPTAADDLLTVTLSDGRSRMVPCGSSVARTLAEFGVSDAVAADLDGHPVDLSATIDRGCVLDPIIVSSDKGRHILRHSAAHVLAQAVTQLWPGTEFATGPAHELGFHYDFALPAGKTITEADLVLVATRMQEIIDADQPFVRQELPVHEALALFEDQSFKCEIINSLSDPEFAAEAGAGSTVSIYRNSESFADLCRGPHLPRTGLIGAFEIRHSSAVYWRGDEEGRTLQRIYGTAWESTAALAEHRRERTEAEARDHRKIAAELDLLSFPSELGGGLAVWHPKGALIRRLMEDYSRERHHSGGYQFVYTPHLANAQLFETSGHLGFYKDGMYPPMEMDNGTYYPKPMNCPMHCLVFNARQRSYRELPLRLFELGTVYRYERAGTLHGLMRIRGFTQDDSHIFCSEEQLEEEIVSLLGFVMSVLRRFGFTEFTANLSTKDPGKYVGADEVWDKATAALEGALTRYGLEYRIKAGDAAFYGPKIDIDVKDAIGRRWQLSTIQCDFNMPERFGLEYVGADGNRHRPIMLHRALFGSIERFFGVLVEHYAGAFPLWLAPTQVSILPVTAAHEDYAHGLASELTAAGVRAQVVEATEGLGRRIRREKTQKVPYVLVVGDDDVRDDTVGVNPRGGEVERGVPRSAFFDRIRTELDETP